MKHPRSGECKQGILIILINPRYMFLDGTYFEKSWCETVMGMTQLKYGTIWLSVEMYLQN